MAEIILLLGVAAVIFDVIKSMVKDFKYAQRQAVTIVKDDCKVCDSLYNCPKVEVDKVDGKKPSRMLRF